MDALSRATGAQVAAATGLIGAAAKGGSWELDVAGRLTHAPLTAVGVASYTGVMALSGTAKRARSQPS